MAAPMACEDGGVVDCMEPWASGSSPGSAPILLGVAGNGPLFLGLLLH